ncbi:Crp/Fnr family transcriptional regulator [Lagierella sp.]|uniref:Crp/Fnr family transcriptional regulator n=1 Tax=Lagierella sp. TaxID=2849657 RepID=UPI0026212504|nr:Crp/Fnr family transcriptional regulator [Lagierella sp.]
MKEIIKETKLFNFLSDEDKEQLSKSVELITVKRGDYVFRPFDKALYMYIIKTGSMKISMDLSDGREQILYVYKDEDFVGGLNLITSDSYLYNGIALTKCQILKISKDDFLNILMHDEYFLKHMLIQSYLRIRKSEELIDRLSVINGDMKVAKSLIDLANRSGYKKEDGRIVVKHNMNRMELGSFSGVARETLIRKLSHFEDLGLIKLLPKGEIEILNLESLKDLTI